jgi:hypothetical protein
VTPELLPVRSEWGLFPGVTSAMVVDAEDLFRYGAE